MAFKKREFTAESGLGFMRVIQVTSILAMFSLLFMLLFVTGYRLQINFEVLTSLFYILSLAVTAWLIGTRKEHTRQIVTTLIGLDAIFSVINMSNSGTFSLPDSLFSLAPNFLLIFYFMFSRRAKAVLVRPFSDFGIEKDRSRSSKEMWNPRSRDFWLRMLIYFFVFCVVGHWMEAGFCMLVKLGIAPGEVAPDDSIQFRDYLNPFYIYGLGFCMCGLLLYPIKEWILKKTNSLPAAFALSFAVNLLFVAAVEYAMGCIVNLDYSVWDYRNQPFNIHGQICLVYSLLFAIVASAVTWFVYPMLEYLFSFVRRDTFHVVFVVSLALFMVLVVTYNINITLPGLDEALVESGVLE